MATAVSKTYHFPKPRPETPRTPKAVFSPDGRLMETYRNFRGQTKWRDADIHKDVQQYRQSRTAGYKANTAQNNAMARFAPVDTNRKITEANRDMINARFSARDNALGAGQGIPPRFMNMQKNRPSGSPGIGMLDTPPGVKPLLSNTRPPDLGNPDFIGPQKPGTGWQDRGSSPYQRIMEHKNMLNDPNEKFGPEAYMQNRMNVEDRQSGSAVVYRPEKGSVMRIDPIKKYAGETGTLAEREQFRQAGDLRTAAINQAETEKQKAYNQEVMSKARSLIATGGIKPEQLKGLDFSDPDKAMNELAKFSGENVTKGKTAAGYQAAMKDYQERHDKLLTESMKTLPPTATPEQRQEMYAQVKSLVGPPPQMPKGEAKKKGKGKTGNNLSALRSRARDESLKSQGQMMEVQGPPPPTSAPVNDKVLNRFRKKGEITIGQATAPYRHLEDWMSRFANWESDYQDQRGVMPFL